MTGIAEHEFNLLHETQAMRNQLIEMLSDSDLAFTLPGNPTLGELCRESGEVEQSYIDSFTTFKHNFSYRNPEPELATSVSNLKTWFTKLDADLEAALKGLADVDVQSKTIDRGWPMPVGAQFHTYREALLIFYAKAVVYLRAMGKPLPEQMRAWIG